MGGTMNEEISAELVLVGGGHAHVQVLRRWMMAPLPGIRLSVVLDHPVAVYSGMVPGVVAGDYADHDVEIDVVPLARRAGARVVLARATGVDPVAHRIELEGRPSIVYDVASFDVGSTVAGLDHPGVAEHALATRPIGDFVRRFGETIERDAGASSDSPLRVVVVGAGAAGLEIAFTLRARLRAEGRAAEVSVLGDRGKILDGYAPRVARCARRAAERDGIEMRGTLCVRLVALGSGRRRAWVGARISAAV